VAPPRRPHGGRTLSTSIPGRLCVLLTRHRQALPSSSAGPAIGKLLRRPPAGVTGVPSAGHLTRCWDGWEVHRQAFAELGAVEGSRRGGGPHDPDGTRARAIAEAPGRRNLPRLAYADWLEEFGDESDRQRAAFIPRARSNWRGSLGGAPGASGCAFPRAGCCSKGHGHTWLREFPCSGRGTAPPLPSGLCRQRRLPRCTSSSARPDEAAPRGGAPDVGAARLRLDPADSDAAA